MHAGMRIEQELDAIWNSGPRGLHKSAGRTARKASWQSDVNRTLNGLTCWVGYHWIPSPFPGGDKFACIMSTI